MRVEGIVPIVITAALFFAALSTLMNARAGDSAGSEAKDASSARAAVSARGPHPDRILVAVGERLPAIRQVALACRLGREHRAEIVLAYVLALPLTVPLDIALPDEEASARKALAAMEFLVKGQSMPVRTRILHSRSVGEGILRLAEDEDVSTIVLGIGMGRWPWSGLLGGTARDVLRRARCMVVLVKAPA